MPRSLALFVLCTGLIGCGKSVYNTTDDTGSNGAAPNLVVDDGAVDFGLADEVNVLLSVQLAVQNTGEGDLSLSNISATPPFDVSTATASVNARGATQIGIFFVPDDYADFTGTLSFDSNDPDLGSVTIDLFGGVVTDADGDGYLREEAGGDDCDDDDAMVNPGADEVWYDGTDADCDGGNDYDQDGDGYEADQINPDPGTGGGDCNDAVAWVYPGAKDEVYDGVDADCAGDSDWDADGDGYGAEALGRGRDCDDTNADVYPGAPERLNFVLDDCDGEIDQDMDTTWADEVWTGDDASQGAGASFAMGDMDGDGLIDLAIGAPDYSGGGAVGLQLTSLGWASDGAYFTDGYHSFTGDGSSDGMGEAMSYADTDGSGGSLVIGAPGNSSNYGAIYAISAADLAAGGNTGDAHTVIQGDSANGYYVGRAIVDGIDLNGDGVDDYLFEYASSTSSNADSYLGLHYGEGGGSGSVGLSSIDARWTTSNREDPPIATLSAGEDIDNDGIDDWMFSDPLYDYALQNDGGVWVLWGDASDYSATGGAITSAGDGWEIVASAGNLEWGGYGGSLLPDLDGDGHAELGWWVKDLGEFHILGGADITAGGVHGTDDSMVAMEFNSSFTPAEIRTMGDWNGDGEAEFLLSLAGSSGSSRLYIFDPVGLSGTIDGDDSTVASFRPSSEDGNAAFGQYIPARPADMDGDGDPDLVVGDPQYEIDLDGDKVEENDAGAVYFYANPSQ